MIDRLTRLYALLTSPLLTPLYVAAAILFCPTAFSAFIPLTYRIAIFVSFAIIASLLPLTVETYLRVKCKIPRGGQIAPRRRRWLYISYAAMLLIAIFTLREAPLFSLVVPLMKGVATLWIVTAAAMTLRSATCRNMIFAGGMTLFLAILALSGAEQWIAILCAALLFSGLTATALVRLGRTTLAGAGIDYLLGMIAMTAALHLL